MIGATGDQVGVMAIDAARELAAESDMDLVEV